MRLFLSVMMLVVLLSACGGVEDAAVTAVEQYLTAKVAGDDDALRPLLCAEKEADFQQEASSFDAVEASIEGMECARDGEVVRCEGAIVAVYGGENTEFPLGAYRVTQEDGAWKWCGETE
jgi:hypothetical protein